MNAHKKKSQRERACAYAAIMLAQLFNNLNRNRMQCDYTVLDTCRWWRKWWPINMYPKDNNVMRSAHCDKLIKKNWRRRQQHFIRLPILGKSSERDRTFACTPQKKKKLKSDTPRKIHVYRKYLRFGSRAKTIAADSAEDKHSATIKRTTKERNHRAVTTFKAST